MKASNGTMTAAQWAVRQNASNGQVTPLLYSSNAADGGSYGLSLQAQAQLANAKNGGANFNYGIAREQNVAYNANQVMGNDNAASIAAFLAKNGGNGGNGGQPKGDLGFYFDSESRKDQNGSTAPQGNKHYLNKGVGIPNDDSNLGHYGAIAGAGEKIAEAVTKYKAVNILSSGNGANLHGVKISKIINLPLEEPANVTKITSQSGRVMANGAKIVTGLNVVGSLASFGSMGVDTYQATAGTKLETFAGSAVASVYGLAGLLRQAPSRALPFCLVMVRLRVGLLVA